MRLRQLFTNTGWVFDIRTDLALYLMIVIVFLTQRLLGLIDPAQVSFFSCLTFQSHQLALALSFFYLTFLDIPHAVSGFPRAYDVIQNKFQLYVVPSCFFLCLWMLFNLGQEWAFRAVTYFNIFHFIQQQYGWLRVSQEKTDPLPRGWFRLEVILMYALTVLPVVMLHASVDLQNIDNFWMFPNDLLFFQSESMYQLTLSLLVAVILVYFILLFWKIFRGWEYPLGRFALFIFTGFAWVGGVFLLRDSDPTLLLDLFHVSSYLVIVLRVRRQVGIMSNSAGVLTNKVFYFVLCGVGFLWAVLFYSFEGQFSMMAQVVFSLIFTVSISHYYFDRYIWRLQKGAKGLGRFLHAH